MKKTLLALALTVATSSSFANEMFDMENAKKSATVGFASVGDYSGVKFGGRIDLASGLYADASYFTVSGDEGYGSYTFDVETSQLKAIVGMHFPSTDQLYWLAEGGFVRSAAEVAGFEVTENDLAYKFGAGWDFGNKVILEGYVASEGGDTFIGGFAKYEINEKFDVTFEYNLYSDAHMFIMAAYKF
ncbi:hypothetical protein GCM10008107_21900 [Psychrosphaera saromensis]|uniref:Outer membrane protein beta-barrel domain-containing protein n=1 Tax=Psychrosphaera saromensis TaxID=716813 RepID=A0A2S7UQP0_9GAMM|nr:hypothetical protein [Psychrosphaera saromensis]PQJ52247.1 hypothetical protein BTO11_00295 [Psychrosphaera saromensis]GHB72138.1 hypothetical protein GCM10008107_21900 [Psychrosphaera saromensis]GLQ13606.1 hypothetical protein GCM10007917_10610 [Psychrosphaera saromensis]